MEEGKIDFKCLECSLEIPTSTIQFFLYQIGENYFDKYEKLSFNQFVSSNVCEMMWCPTPGCEFVFEMAEKFSKFSCRICKKR